MEGAQAGAGSAVKLLYYPRHSISHYEVRKTGRPEVEQNNSELAEFKEKVWPAGPFVAELKSPVFRGTPSHPRVWGPGDAELWAGLGAQGSASLLPLIPSKDGSRVQCAPSACLVENTPLGP